VRIFGGQVRIEAQFSENLAPHPAVLGETKRNTFQKGVDWQFTTYDARNKLKRLYPVIL
jgi:hypothetical protein